MKLSALLICLGALLAATALTWSKMSARRSIKQVYEDVKSGREPRVGIYAMIIAPVSVVLILAGFYLALTWRESLRSARAHGGLLPPCGRVGVDL